MIKVFRLCIFVAELVLCLACVVIWAGSQFGSQKCFYGVNSPEIDGQGTPKIPKNFQWHNFLESSSYLKIITSTLVSSAWCTGGWLIVSVGYLLHIILKLKICLLQEILLLAIFIPAFIYESIWLGVYNYFLVVPTTVCRHPKNITLTMVHDDVNIYLALLHGTCCTQTICLLIHLVLVILAISKRGMW